MNLYKAETIPDYRNYRCLISSGNLSVLMPVLELFVLYKSGTVSDLCRFILSEIPDLHKAKTIPEFMNLHKTENPPDLHMAENCARPA
jgi:hypothetical protein